MIDIRDRITNGYTGRYALDPVDVIGVAVHHSVSGSWFFVPPEESQEDEIQHLLAIDNWHAQLGWGGFGYHVAAFPSGRVYYCGSLINARAHVASRNDELIGLVLIGDFTSSPPPARQLQAAAEGLHFIHQAYPGRTYDGHRMWALPEHPTACPGDTMVSWVYDITKPQEVDTMRELLVLYVGHWYYVGGGYRVHLGPKDGCPGNGACPGAGPYKALDVPVGSIDNLFAIPSIEDMITERTARPELTGAYKLTPVS